LYRPVSPPFRRKQVPLLFSLSHNCSLSHLFSPCFSSPVSPPPSKRRSDCHIRRECCDGLRTGLTKFFFPTFPSIYHFPRPFTQSFFFSEYFFFSDYLKFQRTATFRKSSRCLLFLLLFSFRISSSPCCALQPPSFMVRTTYDDQLLTELTSPL